MSDPIEQLAQHVNQLLSRQTHPLFLAVDEGLRLVSVRGDPAHFGLPSLEPGDDIGGHLPLLSTLDANSRAPQYWRFVELPGAPVCHVHLIRMPTGWGVALLDASVEHAEQQARQQSAHELLLLRDERERLLAELEQANRLKGEFIARMSHEFRTPLTSVIGYGEQLREQCDTDKMAMHHIGAVIRGGRYLLNLVENLLDQARVEIDQLQLNPGACDLHELSEETEQLLRPLAEQKRLSLAWWFDGEIPPRVWLDATRLQQILVNLVGNAIKFTREGGINVEFTWQQGRLAVAICDSGPGISDNQVATIFEPYQQASSSQRSKGAGLGLTISRALVRAMGGDIEVQSNPGGGSCFRFDIDADRVQPGGAQVADVLAGRKVLIADDDPDLLDLFSLYLRAAGCTVERASDAESTRLTARRFRPDIIILDLNLGDSLGTDVAAELRREGYRQRLALLSAAAPATTATDQGDTTFDACWHKPIGRAQLLEGVAELLG